MCHLHCNPSKRGIDLCECRCNCRHVINVILGFQFDNVFYGMCCILNKKIISSVPLVMANDNVRSFFFFLQRHVVYSGIMFAMHTNVMNML